MSLGGIEPKEGRAATSNRPGAPMLGLSPTDVAALPAEQVPALIAALASLQAAAAAKLAAVPSYSGHQSTPETLIPVEEAARMAGVTPEQFRRRLAFRRALVKLGHRTTRVSEKRLRRILAEL